MWDAWGQNPLGNSRPVDMRETDQELDLKLERRGGGFAV